MKLQDLSGPQMSGPCPLRNRHFDQHWFNNLTGNLSREIKGGETAETKALFPLIKGCSSEACWCDPKPVAAKSVPPFWKILSKLSSLHQNKNVDYCPVVDPRVSTISVWSAWPQLRFFDAVYTPAPSHARARILLGRGETCCLRGDLQLICLALQSIIKQLLAHSSCTLVVFLTHCLSLPQHIKLLYLTKAVASSGLCLLN